ncbi:MAG: hypothetical protein IT425_08250 [Pirellulales bacterium]|nr:hypothetical protein [Pirellulales bacterium]
MSPLYGVVCTLAVAFGGTWAEVHGQEEQVINSGPGGQQVQLSPEQVEEMRQHGGFPPGMGPGGPPGAPPGVAGQPTQSGKPGEGQPGKKKEGEGGEAKKDEPSKSIARPEKPPRVPDPREFEVKLDEQGRVPAFSFIGQPWPDVLQWLATVSKCSLDWQELPNDYLNLTTQRPYTLDEVRDLVNRHLLSRGYISIQSGGILSVFKLDKLDPSLVSRASEDQLYDLKPYDLAKVSFELPKGMELEKAKNDVKQVLNPTAKVFPLVSSNRLLVLDTVANLRMVSELLNQERMVVDGRIVPKEYVLKYTRPEKVIDILYVVLGMDPKSRPSQMDLQIQQQKMQMLAQMQQRGTDVSKMLKKDGPPVYLAYNRQRNSILANAPLEQLKIIEQTISYLDVPFGGAADETNAESAGQRTMKKYPLTTLDPGKFLATLEEIGGLSPTAELKVDDESRTLFAMATEADHARINSLIDQFDGSGRQFEVIALRRLPADAVAASINKLMGQQSEEKEDRDQFRNPWDWDPWDHRPDRKKQVVRGFGVDADIDHNRLLMWANEAEMKRVRELLEKLGEIPSGQPSPRPIRTISPADSNETAAILEKVRAAWPAAGGNELIIHSPPTNANKAGEAEEAPPSQDRDAKPEGKAEPAADRATSADAATRIAARYAQLEAAENRGGETAVASPTVPPTLKRGESGPPVTITVTEDGRLVLSSTDSAALDRLEEMIEALSPPQKRFRIFQCKYIRASEMWYDLTDFFEDEIEGKAEGYIRDWNGYWVPTGGDKEGGTGLAKRRKLMITYDRPSNSILVANASATQLAEIEQLIQEFDKPTKSDSVEIRMTAAIKIKYSRPSVIAAAVKEVYRDLLSSRDKEFDRGDKREERSGVERMTVLSFGGPSSTGSSNDRQSPVKIGFDGALSLGADDVSGVLVISAQKAIFDDIVRLVQELDEQASPKTTVQVLRLGGNVPAESIQKTLDKAVGKSWLGNRPEPQPNNTGSEGESRRGNRNRNRDRGGENPPGEES